MRCRARWSAQFPLIRSFFFNLFVHPRFVFNLHLMSLTLSTPPSTYRCRFSNSMPSVFDRVNHILNPVTFPSYARGIVIILYRIKLCNIEHSTNATCTICTYGVIMHPHSQADTSSSLVVHSQITITLDW